MDERRSTQKHLEEEEHLEYIYHGSPSDYFNTRMSIETYVTAKEPDSESLKTIGDEVDAQKDGEESIGTTVAELDKSELYQDPKSTNDKEVYNDHGRGLPLKQFIIVYTGYFELFCAYENILPFCLTIIITFFRILDCQWQFSSLHLTKQCKKHRIDFACAKCIPLLTWTYVISVSTALPKIASGKFLGFHVCLI